MSIKYTSLVTGDERILLYLLDVPYQKSELKELVVVPDIITTQAIADAVSLEKHYTSKHLKKLLDQKLIQSLLTRVKGKTRKQKIYFLTSKGRETANHFKNDLMEQEITIMEHTRKLKTLKFSKVAKFLKTRKTVKEITDLELCKLINNKLILNINQIPQTKQKYISIFAYALFEK